MKEKMESPVQQSKVKEKASVNFRVPEGALKLSLKGFEIGESVCVTVEGKIKSMEAREKSEYSAATKAFELEPTSIEVSNKKPGLDKLDMKEYRKQREG